MSGARTTLTTGTWCSTTRTCGTKDPTSGICVSAASNGVVSATSTLNVSWELLFCTDEKSGTKLKSTVAGLRSTFPPPLGSLTTV